MADRAIPRPSCPICGRPTEVRWRPFCSRRCADVDLARWLGGVYAVPVVEPDEEDEAGLERAAGPEQGKERGDQGD